ncbi:mitochondrial mRNA pseudouridine synthase RPUSD3-like [Liolophura sinensis]|uniref:mitochondrial mRNA pseudouridine synthase RPUSD3-like n=1 Tax=Liolophura sinensis TaxID=3198878 RepID=UPI003158B6C0
MHTLHKLTSPPAHLRCVVRTWYQILHLCSQSESTSQRLSTDNELSRGMGCEPTTNLSSGETTEIPNSVSRQQLVKYLLNHAPYQDDHILAINKPNGFPILVPKPNVFGSSVIYLDSKVQGGEIDSDKVSYQREPRNHRSKKHKFIHQPYETSLSLTDVLPDIQEHVNSPELEIGMTLPRLYSGIVVLTKTEHGKMRLKKYLETVRSQRSLYQSFSCLTVGTPSTLDKESETVMCKLAEIDGRTLTVPTGDVSINTLKKGEAVRIEVSLQRVCENKQLGCALLAVKPTRDKWDVVEWYCTRRLCCVLGDNVYSARVGSILGVPSHVEPHIALPQPQEIPEKILQKLHLRKEYVPYLPLHVHRGCVELTGIPHRKADPIFIRAPIPEFFSDSLRYLNLHMEKR